MGNKTAQIYSNRVPIGQAMPIIDRDFDEVSWTSYLYFIFILLFILKILFIFK